MVLIKTDTHTRQLGKAKSKLKLSGPGKVIKIVSGEKRAESRSCRTRKIMTKPKNDLDQPDLWSKILTTILQRESRTLSGSKWVNIDSSLGTSRRTRQNSQLWGKYTFVSFASVS